MERSNDGLADVVGAASTYDEVIAELRPALRAFLQSYIERGQTPPLPTDPTLWRVQLLPIAAAAERRHEVPLGAHVTQAPVTAAA